MRIALDHLDHSGHFQISGGILRPNILLLTHVEPTIAKQQIDNPDGATTSRREAAKGYE